MASGLHWDEKRLIEFQKRIGTEKGRIVRLSKPTKESKHKAIPRVVDGVRFASGLEARVWGEHRLLEKAGKIRNLRRQVRFSLFANQGEHIGVYTADMVFEELQEGVWKRVVADVKSEHTRTLPAWRRTKRLMLACHGYAVRELP
jgi:hypothetical protein